MHPVPDPRLDAAPDPASDPASELRAGVCVGRIQVSFIMTMPNTFAAESARSDMFEICR